ncbi:MAG: hypothetical protein RLZZ628_2615 [Bacteroidota bacterium]|jgi:hypothetical protein
MNFKQIILCFGISAPMAGCFKPIVFNPVPTPFPTTTTTTKPAGGTTTTTTLPKPTGTTTTGTGTTTTGTSTTTTGAGTTTTSAKTTDADNIIAGKLPKDTEDLAPNTASYVNFFTGVARKDAKTSISTARTEIFETTGDLLVTLAPDGDMHAYSPKIRQSTPRVAEEDRNVYIKNTYIFSVKKEDDLDFHIIIGDLSATGDPINLMNVELAGLPEDVNSKDFKIMKKARSQFYAKYPAFFDTNKKTMFCDPPVPISLRGSLFFDTQHSAGNVGSKNLKPLSVWEIHPITYIKFK